MRNRVGARPVLAVAIGLLALSCASSRAASRPLSDILPHELPAAAERATWERIDGDYDTLTEHVRYALFVDPQRPLLFLITQFRVSLRPRPGNGRSRVEDGYETVIWNETPGERVPLRCFEEERSGRSSSRRAPSSWRDVAPSTSEFRAHMHRALEIYGRVHAEGRAGPPVARDD